MTVILLEVRPVCEKSVCLHDSIAVDDCFADDDTVVVVVVVVVAAVDAVDWRLLEESMN